MKRIRKIADDFAREMKILYLPIEIEKLEEIADKNGWKIVSYSKGYNFIKSENLEKYYYTSKGFTYSSYDCTIIFIKDDLEYLDKINVICHEIGHLILKHIEIGTSQKSISANFEDKVQEEEADIFALVLQAPTYIMQSLAISNAHSLFEMGVFSKTNAKLRYKYFFQDIYYDKIKFNLLFGITLAILVALITYTFTKNYYSDTYKRSIQNLQTTVSTTDIITENTTLATNEYIETPTEIISFNNSSDTSKEIVYITKSGKKYHKPDCHYIKGKETISISINNAELEGYSACSVCFK